ncbi:MAG: GNAT family N-acetyltransferase [Jatrophihabitans sp.]|uniref:GNAT family N-acetyltransferase n=1 Tax=Jatrophihabitans sp. TaxID=1932789 RepID=UPI003F7D5AB9
MTAQRTLETRPVTQADLPFLRDLFVESRPGFDLLPPMVVDQQLLAQRWQYRLLHPAAVDEIVLLDGAPVGRVWTSVEDGRLHLLDLAVRAAHRRRGIARVVLGRLASTGLPIELQVWRENDAAIALYRSTGFVEVGHQGGGHLAMHRPASSSDLDRPVHESEAAR